MSLTLGQMRDRVRRPLRDTGRFISDAEIDEWLNEVQVDIAARTLCIQREATGTTTTYQLTLPADYIDESSFYLGTETDPVQWISNEDWDSWSKNSVTPPVTVGRIFAVKMEFYPAPASGTAYVHRYFATPAILNDDSDVPEVLATFQFNMIRYAIAQAKAKDGEMGEFESGMQQFEKGLPDTKGPTTNFKPGPITVGFEPGPFDTADAIHI